MAQTTNIGLYKLGAQSKLKDFPSLFNDDLDIIDSTLGYGFGQGGNPTVKASIDAQNSKFEDRVVDNVHYINGTFDTSQTTLINRVIDVLSQISTESKYTIFDVIIAGAGRFNFNGYLYSDKTYGSGYLFSFDNVYRWVRNNGTDSLEEVALNSNLSSLGTVIVGTNSTGSVSVPNNTPTSVSTVTITKGVWLIIGSADWASNGTGYRQVSFGGDGTNPGRFNTSTANGISGKEAYQQISFVKTCTQSSETLTMHALQNSGSSLSVYPYAIAVKIGM